MTRRFQFSLRALLGTVVFGCLILGAGSLLKSKGQFVRAEPTKVGEPILIRGRVILFGGPGRFEYHLSLSTDGMTLIRSDQAERSWLCLYNVEEAFEPSSEPRRYVIKLIGALQNEVCLQSDVVIK